MLESYSYRMKRERIFHNPRQRFKFETCDMWLSISLIPQTWMYVFINRTQQRLKNEVFRLTCDDVQKPKILS